jgi:channel protein (hemolysin III family)
MRMPVFARGDLYSLPGFHDPVSAMSHLFAAPVFLVLSYYLLRRGRGNTARLIFLGIFAFASVFLLSMSGVYHMMESGGTARLVMERLDHSAIFFLIAGTFTPAHGILFRGWARWGPLLLIWACAITGITLKAIFFDDLDEGLGLSLFLGLGWIGMVSAGVLWQRYGVAFVWPLLLGAVFYTVGAVLEYLTWPVIIPGVVEAHEMFHLAVLAGLAFHWEFVFQFASGTVAQPPHAAVRSR